MTGSAPRPRRHGAARRRSLSRRRSFRSAAALLFFHRRVLCRDKTKAPGQGALS
ncbi:uncharacterized protein AruCF_5703 [Achromobacter ruhlandii]|nr:uncharacterized protein AruCF_5703 [Achromobacter ruhlandii]